MDASLSFGGHLRQLRLQREKTLTETAKAIGVTPQYYCSIEKDQKGVLAADRIEKIVHFLCLTEDEKKELYDLAAEGRKRKDVAIPQDFAPYIRECRYVAEALRVARDSDAGEEEWQKFIDDLKERKRREKR